MKESKAMMKKEVAFMKKKGAPKSMIRHEEKEYGMKKGVKKMAFGGMTGLGGLGGMGGLREGDTSYQLTGGRRGTDSQLSGANRLARPKQATGVMVPGGKLSGLRAGMKKGGSVGGSYRKAADGVAHKGKTKGKMVKMAYGGKC